jgi:2TM domain
MSSNVPNRRLEPDHDSRAAAQRWVRRQRVLYTMLGIYVVLSVMWLAIDLADGTENLWFYWPMLGTGVVVAVTAVVLLGVGGLLGTDWERRQVDRYLRRHGDAEPTEQAPAGD